MLLPASALQPISTNGTLAAKPCRVAYKKDITYLKRRAQQREGKFVTHKHGKPYKGAEARVWSTNVFFFRILDLEQAVVCHSFKHTVVAVLKENVVGPEQK